MKHLLALSLALLSGAAFATNKPEPSPSASSHSSAVSGPSSAVTGPSTATAGPSTSAATAGPSSANGGDYSVIALPGAGSAAPLPAGMCTTGHSEAWGVLWNAVWTSKSDTRTDHECLRLWAELERLRATPVPRPAVQILTQPVDSQTCAPPAKAKSVAEAKKAGSCGKT